jgi:hypothetical protein
LRQVQHEFCQIDFLFLIQLKIKRFERFLRLPKQSNVKFALVLLYAYYG